MSASQQLDPQDPVMLSWKAFEGTTEFKNATAWLQGSMWAAFLAGIDHQKGVPSDLKRELDEADRRAGEAERRLEDVRDTLYRMNSARDEQKRQAGYSTNVSFDIVWQEVLFRSKALNHPERLSCIRLIESLIARCDRTGRKGPSIFSEEELDQAQSLLAQLQKPLQ